MNSSDQPGFTSQTIHPIRGKWRQRKGVALILVVSFIVLLSALVVGFFSRVTTDLNGARSYAEGISARQLAESAVSVVMGQIRAATTITNGCWASQPGMIRVYGGANGVAGSQAYRFYKLYSSHNMVLEKSGTKDDFKSFDPHKSAFTNPASGANAEVPIGPGGWQFQPAFFTDLNEPAAVPDSNNVGQTVKRYPIFDPSIAIINGSKPANWVEGCEVNITDAQTLALNNAPMPVRWIYVLRDGTLTAPTPLTSSASGNTGIKAIWNNLGSPTTTPSTGVPSKENPIVGRIAFWADDDTCKVNINTAGGYIVDDTITPNYSTPQKTPTETNPAFIPGSFWDTPRVQTYFDSGISGPPDGTQSDAAVHYGLNHFRPGLANSQPVRNEFQRYPGHPSTTSLGLVLSGLLPKGTGLDSEKLYDLTPRLTSGRWNPGDVHAPQSLSKNSQGGTKQLIVYGQTLDPNTTSLDPDPASTMKKTFDTVSNPSYTASDAKTWSYHLLSSVDELYYSTLNSTLTSSGANSVRTSADKQLSLSNAFTPEIIDKARFFLTAHSRSPELSLFGRPRVTIWPVPSWNSEAKLRQKTNPVTKKIGIRNPSDDLFRFCSTIGADPNDAVNNASDPPRPGQFIFDREDPLSSTADFNRQRNKLIFDYLNDVTSNSVRGKIPGWGPSFEGKYSVAPGGRSQILAEIFDYIRSVNLKDTSRDELIDKAYGRDASRLVNGSPPPKIKAAEDLKDTARYATRGIVVPTKTTYKGSQISGFGRFPTISEVSLVFYHGGYTYENRKKPNGDDVEYDYNLVDERNYKTNAKAQTWQDTNKLTGKLVRAFLIFETFNPMQGYGPVTDFVSGAPNHERIVHEISNLAGFMIKTGNDSYQSLGLGSGKNNIWRSSGNTWAGRNFGGPEGFFHTLQDKTNNNGQPQSFPWGAGAATKNYLAAGSYTTDVTLPPGLTSAYYPFQTPCATKLNGIKIPITVGNTKPGDSPEKEPTTFDFNGGTFDLTIRFMNDAYSDVPKHDGLTPIQTIKIKFPEGSGWPLPITEREAKTRGEGYRYQSTLSQIKGQANADNSYDFGGFNRYVPGFNADDGTANWGTGGSSTLRWESYGGYRMPYFLPLRIAWAAQHSYSPWLSYNGVNNKSGNQATNGKRYTNRFLQILQPGDTIRSLVPGGNISQSTDPRLVSLPLNVAESAFQKHPDYSTGKRRAQTLRRGDGGFYFDPENPVINSDDPTVSLSTNMLTGVIANLPANTRYIGGYGPDLPRGVAAKRADIGAADFDTGIGNFPDGAFCGKADEGNIARAYYDSTTQKYTYVQPYFSTWAYDSPGDTYFSPNRQIPSPVMFGSLLAPWKNPFADNGWKTLLFCPNYPGIGDVPLKTHPGLNTIPDHLLLDLFNMPVVEPYAISEPFSTDGKVNLNYQLMPFGYIERSTALRAALQPLRITAIPSNFTRNNAGATELRYKGVDNEQNLRYLVDRDETLKSFKGFFDNYSSGQTGAGFFKSASQVCEMFLYPKGVPIKYFNTIKYKSGDTDIKTWWASCSVTGDNLREKPYSDLYSRVTTKSNTYTVHYRVQSLRQQPYTGNAAGAAAYYGTWDESRDKVMSEYRGHTTIERYLDPRDSRFDTDPNKTPQNPPDPNKFYVDKQSLEAAYRFRVIYNKRFSPW